MKIRFTLYFLLIFSVAVFSETYYSAYFKEVTKWKSEKKYNIGRVEKHGFSIKDPQLNGVTPASVLKRYCDKEGPVIVVNPDSSGSILRRICLNKHSVCQVKPCNVWIKSHFSQLGMPQVHVCKVSKKCKSEDFRGSLQAALVGYFTKRVRILSAELDTKCCPLSESKTLIRYYLNESRESLQNLSQVRIRYFITGLPDQHTSVYLGERNGKFGYYYLHLEAGKENCRTHLANCLFPYLKKENKELKKQKKELAEKRAEEQQKLNKSLDNIGKLEEEESKLEDGL